MTSGKNILIVDGFATGNQYAAAARARGLVPFHITSGLEKTSSLPAEFMDKYIAGQIAGKYEKCFVMPPTLEEAVQLLKKYHFAAVIPGTESGVIAAEQIAHRLGLPVNNPALLYARRDKYLMQKALQEAGLAHIDCVLTEDVETAVQWFKKSGHRRIIIKPPCSAGTDGVKSCASEAEIRAYFEHCYLNRYDGIGAFNKALLLQPYVEGDELVVNCVSRHGKHVLTDVILYNKVLTSGGVPMYEASRLIHKLDERIQQAVRYTFQVLDALGIQYGSSHSEVKLTASGPVLVETGARIMGSTPAVYYQALGYSLIDWSLDAYLSDAAHERNARQGYHPKKHFMAKFFLSFKEADVEEITALKTLPLLSSFVSCNFNNLAITKKLKPTVDLPSKPGDCFLMSEREGDVLRDYALCRYLERQCAGLLYRCKGEELSAREQQFAQALKNRSYPLAAINRFLYGYDMAYKNYKNSTLYILHPDLTPCQPGETGCIYVAGAYMAKKAYDMPCLHTENFVSNPFYTTACANRVLFPFLYNTTDKAQVNQDGSLTFIDAKTGSKIRSFSCASSRAEWPLTYTERQMVAEQQVAPDSNAYNAKFTFKIEGALNAARLQEALKIWVSRYRLFRSYYPVVNGKFAHRLAKEVPVHLTRFTCTAQEALAKIEQLNTPYDLTRAPLFRFVLFKTGPKEHIFHINIHHIIADGTSLISIIEELWKLYKNKRAKKFHLEKQDFLDYAVWQERYEDPTAKKQFFLDLFKDGVPENEMPIRTLRPEILPHATQVSRELLFDVNKIETAARRLHISTALFMTVATSLTLAKYCDSEDLALGMIMNGRTHPQTRQMVGMFVNSVPIRFQPKVNLTLAEYIAQSAVMFRGALENQTCPFELLAPLLAPKRNLSRKPVFDVIVNYRGEIRPYETAGLKISSIQMWQATQIDLQFEIVRGVSGMSVSISYSDQLYKQAIINGILDLFEKVIEEMTAPAPEQKPLADIMDLPAKQKDVLLKNFVGQRVKWPLQETFLDVFARRCQEQRQQGKNGHAVVYHQNCISYLQLDAWSSQIAALLHKQGVGKGKYVSVLIKRSELMPVCALGVVKAGAAYVPLDEAHPSTRLEYILQDTQTDVLIADEALLPLVPNYRGKVITTRQIRQLADKPAVAPAWPAPKPEDIFVVLYTSGTTGKPKGVLITHRNIQLLCLETRQFFAVTAQDHTATCAGFGFDACLGDWYPTLAAWACLYIVDEETRADLHALNDYFEKEHITRLIMTTQLGRQFATGIKNHSLRQLLVGGETLTPLTPPADYVLYNAYGPTECTVYVSFFKVDKLYPRIPLGKPIYNADIYMVDKSGRLCPPGTYGELCIAGPQVAKGYLNLPQLTAERFVPNPFSQEKGYERMYKTGDVARFTSVGNIDFLGRRDHQVKVRGFRIELSEIESCLRKHPLLKDCAVVVQEDKNGGKHVAAYVVSGEKLDTQNLKRFIEDALPPYMVPEFILQIPAIPLNPNGKVNRAALPNVSEAYVAKRSYVAPESRVEKELALIWGDILDIKPETISREDNFFDMGGTSLRATELSFRVREAFKESMPPATIFKYPALKAQAEYLEKQNRFSMVYAFNESGTKTPMFFVHTANTGAEAYVPLVKKLPKDQPFYAVEPHNIFSSEPPIRGIKNLAKRYVQYISQVNATGPYILGGWSFGAVVAYEMAVLLRAQGKQVEQVFLLDPIINHSESEKALTRQLLDTSFFQGYLNNDPLFLRFKKLGFMDKLIENNKNVLEDMFDYTPSPYGGPVTIFKAMRLEAPPKDVDKKLAQQMRKFQIFHRDEPKNGFDKYVKEITLCPIHSIHNYMLRGNALVRIAEEIFSPRRGPKKK